MPEPRTATAITIADSASWPLSQLGSDAIFLAASPSLLPLTRTLRAECTMLRFLSVTAKGTTTRTASQVHCAVLLTARWLLPDYDAYMLTGGAGGIGRMIITRIAHSSTRRILVTSRSAASWETSSLAMESHSRQSAHPTTTLPSARGVLHMAGMLRDGVVSSLTPMSFEVVFGPKVHCTEWTVLRSCIVTLVCAAAGVGGVDSLLDLSSAGGYLTVLVHRCSVGLSRPGQLCLGERVP